MKSTREIMESAKNAAPVLASAGSDLKNSALEHMAEALEEHAEEILAENVKDMEAAKGKYRMLCWTALCLTRKEYLPWQRE